MRCEDAARALYAGASVEGLEIHLSACDECREIAEDLEALQETFARAREEWSPSPRFAVPPPAVPWKRMAIAAGLLFLLTVPWAISSMSPPRPEYDLGILVEPRPPDPAPSDRDILAGLLFEEGQP